MSKTKTAPKLEINGKEVKVRALTLGEQCDIMDESSVINEKGQVVVKTGNMRILTIKTGLVSPKLTEEQIRNLPQRLGMEVYVRIIDAGKVPLEPSPASS